MWKQIKYKISDQVFTQTRYKISDQVFTQAWIKIRNPVSKQVGNQIVSIRAQVRENK